MMRENKAGNGLTDWQLLEAALACEGIRTIYVYGPWGVGKTYAAFKFGRVERGFYTVTLTEEMSAAEVRGHFLFKGGDAFWHDGPFVRAMREGKRLVINEPTHASGDVIHLLYAVLDSAETAELTLPTGETIRPAPGFHVVCTDNRTPDALPEALQDRFNAFVRVSEPHPDALAGLTPELRCAAEATLKLEDERRISARGWKTVQALVAEFGLYDACRLAFGPERGPLVHDAIRLAQSGRKRS